jgi:hypothetical protein
LLIFQIVRIIQIKTGSPPLDSTELADEKPEARAWLAHAPSGDSDRPQGLEYKDPNATDGGLFIAIGSALALVGVVDLAFLWFPLQLGTAGWEFVTVSRTFTNAPMTMVGLVFIASGLMRRGTRPETMRRVAFAFAALSFVLVLLGMLFGLAAPAVLAQTSGETAVLAMKRAMMKNGVEIVVYPITLVVIAAILMRGVREKK